MNRKIISLSGTSSVGKTTVFNYLKTEPMFSHSYNFYGETTRTIRSLGISINEAGAAASQTLIAGMHLWNLERPGNLILDRSLIDCLAYTQILYKDSGDYMLGKTLEYVEDLFFQTIKDINYFVYFPIEFELEKDGERTDNDEWRARVDQVFQGIFQKYRIEHLTVTGNVGQRLHQIKEFVK